MGLILLTVLVVEWPMLRAGKVPFNSDAINYFYPLNSLTGRILRSGALPFWNPYQMGGMPLMGDPQAGWGNLLAMLTFTFLPITQATAILIAAQTALASIGTLLWLRSTGTSVAGAVLGALVYGVTAHMAAPDLDISYGNFAYTGTVAWLPWLILGSHLAVRCSGRLRLFGWMLVGFSASQELSVWLGQGAYYAFAATAAYVFFLIFLAYPSEEYRFWQRTREFVLHSIAFTAMTVALSAWTLFPRLEFVLASNLRTGYGSKQEQLAGGAHADLLAIFFQSGAANVGAPVVVLVLMSLLLRPTRAQLFYLFMMQLTFALSLTALVDLVEKSEAWRTTLGLVPGMLTLHLHHPQRIVFLFIFFGAALAGTSLDRLLAVPQQAKAGLAIAISLLSALTIASVRSFPGRDYWPFLISLVLVLALVPLAWWKRRAVPMVAVFLAILTAGIVAENAVRAHETLDINQLETFYGDAGTLRSVEWLRSSEADGRFFGYAPSLLQKGRAGYRWYRHAKSVRPLLATSQATLFELEDVQGYNPLHLSVYDRLLLQANGKEQNYRNANVLPGAIDSPLLDMLSARYVLTQSDVKLHPSFVRRARHGETYLYENTQTLPRAWVVHRVQVHDDQTALALIDEGTIKPGRTAAVSHPMTGIEPAMGNDSVMLEEYDYDRIQVRTALRSSGLLVLSELDYPAWKVKVDGTPRPVIRANGALRAVEVSRGTHVVTWYYDPDLTQVGFLLSIVTAITAIVTASLWSRLARYQWLKGV